MVIRRNEEKPADRVQIWEGRAGSERIGLRREAESWWLEIPGRGGYLCLRQEELLIIEKLIAAARSDGQL